MLYPIATIRISWPTFSRPRRRNRLNPQLRLMAGTTGQSRRLEAVRVRLTGEAAKKGNYSVWYRVHSQDYGWLGWTCDGEPAGTTGLSKRAEAIDVQVLPQGQVPKGYDASRAACVTR